jgi:hypothetical protein
MSLHTLFKSLLTEARKSTPDLPVGTLTFAQPYGQLRYGEVDGIGTVTIDQTGNMIGFSPVERCSANGETTWIPLERIKNLRMEPTGFVSARASTKAGKAA